MGFGQILFEKFLHKAATANDQEEMSFVEHLEELRKQIIKAAAGIFIAAILCIFFSDFIVGTILLQPIKNVGLKLQVLSPYGKVLLYMEAILFAAVVISMPYTLYCLWKFVAPGLLPKERRYIAGIVFYTALCFFIGVAFSYFLLVPAALNFFVSFGTPDIALNIAVDQYVSFMLALILGGGLVFELPMISYFLSKMGLLTPAFMRKYRRHAIVVIFIIAAVVTPTPDMVTQTLLALPMYFLYELSIWISKFSQKKKSSESASSTS
ncbi:MAG TPA: twin-arginine translocase subunit TatC [Bacteroidota bacterium]|nr:twin-arginine translocase subunit TatC [Bacteroidota bacterium]